MAKVLIHSLIFAPDGVSTAYLYTDLAIELKRLGHEVTVLTTTPHFNVNQEQQKRQPLKQQRQRWLFFSEIEGIPIWHIAMPRKSGDVGVRIKQMIIFHVRALQFSLCRSGRYDVILSPSPPLTIGVISWALAKKFRAKTIYNVQELYPDFAINQGMIKNSFLIWALRKLESFVYAKSERIITIGEKFQKTVVSRKVPKNKVLTIPNFVDTDLYRPMERDNPFAQQYHLVDRFVVMYAGNIGLAQYWEPILNAAEKVKEEIYFVVIGDGTRKNWLELEVKGRGLDNILLLGYQPRERMAEINASSDVATIIMDARVEDDGFPSKIYTTMACGRPSVIACSEGSELAKIIKESKCGTRVSLENSTDYINALLAYKKDQNRIVVEGMAGRAFVESRYSRVAVGLMYHEMIQNLISS